MENQHVAAHDAGAEWRAVTEALNALGDSIARASAAPVAEDENRRRMRELSEGLASLAARIGAAAAESGSTTGAANVSPIRTAAPPVVEAPPTPIPIPTSSEAPPSVRDAFMLATEKFRAAESADRASVSPATIEAVTAAPPTTGLLPVEPAVETAPEPVSAEQVEAASITGSFKAVIADRVSSIIGGVANRVGVQLGSDEEAEEQPESSIQEWLFPEGLPEAELQVDSDLEPAPGMAEPAAPATAGHAAPEKEQAPARPAGAPAAAEVLSPEEVLRVAHERFKAERRLAVESANKAREFAEAHRKGKHSAKPAPPPDDTATLW